jgi:hypothetical protein
MLNCSLCRTPIATVEELLQVPLAITDNAFTCTPMSGEPIPYHQACWDADVA